jgi:hypothetical protein
VTGPVQHFARDDDRVAFNSGPSLFAQNWFQLITSTMRCVLGSTSTVWSLTTV